jgi:N-methylhydantoinase A
MHFATVQRGDVEIGRRTPGPAIVYEPTTTTYVDADFSYGIDENGCLLMRREGQKR